MKAKLLKSRKKTIFKLVGWDVECVLTDMGKGEIIDDPEIFCGLVEHLADIGLSIPWSEYLEESISYYLENIEDLS